MGTLSIATGWIEPRICAINIHRKEESKRDAEEGVKETDLIFLTRTNSSIFHSDDCCYGFDCDGDLEFRFIWNSFATIIYFCLQHTTKIRLHPIHLCRCYLYLHKNWGHVFQIALKIVRGVCTCSLDGIQTRVSTGQSFHVNEERYDAFPYKVIGRNVHEGKLLVR